MTTNKASGKARLLIGLLLAALVALPAEAADRRAKDVKEALAAGSPDGVAVFVYGPEWNARSVRMLNSFWQRPEVEEATLGATLTTHAIHKTSSGNWWGDMARYLSKNYAPICPAVVLLDNKGNEYAMLTGFDDLGDEKGTAALGKLREKITALRKRNELKAKAEELYGEERARVLHEIAELPILPPATIEEELLKADPSDKHGYVRRLTYNPLQFLYEQLETQDGFLSPRFVPDVPKIRNACLKIVNDEALRPQDRQMAYALLIGMMRREKKTGKMLKDMINASMKIDPNTDYGRLSPELVNKWGSLKFNRTSEDRRRNREEKKERTKEQQEQKRRAKRIEIR